MNNPSGFPVQSQMGNFGGSGFQLNVCSCNGTWRYFDINVIVQLYGSHHRNCNFFRESSMLFKLVPVSRTWFDVVRILVEWFGVG